MWHVTCDMWHICNLPTHVLRVLRTCTGVLYSVFQTQSLATTAEKIFGGSPVAPESMHCVYTTVWIHFNFINARRPYPFYVCTGVHSKQTEGTVVRYRTLYTIWEWFCLQYDTREISATEISCRRIKRINRAVVKQLQLLAETSFFQWVGYVTELKYIMCK